MQKFESLRQPLIGVKQRLEEEKNKKNSASADGGPRSRVCARETLSSAHHRREWKFSRARVCRVAFGLQNGQNRLFPHFLVKIGLFWGVGGVPEMFFSH